MSQNTDIMQVCLLNDSFPPVIDGVANTVMNYAQILTDKGFAKVQVATPRYPEADYSGYPYEVVPYKSFSIGNMVEGYRAGNPLDIPAISELAGASPQLIHSHCPVVSTMVARSLRMRTKAPIIFTYHTKFDVDIAHAVRNSFIRKEATRVLVDNIEACDEVWTVSHGAGENLCSLGFNGEYRVVENGVDFPKGQADQEQVREAVKDYDLPEGVPVYLFVGRLMNYKGLPLIVDALGIMKEQGADFRMIFIGGGGDEESLKEKVEELGLQDRVIFTGPIRDRQLLRAWNTRADLFLFPSTYDTNGIVVREAAACGLASVLVRGSCAAEGITEGRNGFFIDENARSLAGLLLSLGNDIGRMRDAGQHAMDEIYISWEQSVTHAYDLYQEVLENKAAGKYQTKLQQRMQDAKEVIHDSDKRRRQRLKRTEEHWKELLTGLGRMQGSFVESMTDNMQQLKTGIKGVGSEAGKIGRNAWDYAREILYGDEE